MSAGRETYGAALRRAASCLQEADVPDAAYDAWALMEHVTGMNRAAYYLRAEEEMPSAARADYEEMVRQRAKRIPLQHLTGTAWFMGLPFRVDSRVLIPRADTEKLVEIVLERQRAGELGEAPRLLDVCTGSGCIAVSLAVLGTFAAVTAADLSPEALGVARRNAQANGCESLRLVQGDLLAPLAGERFEVITANPPYIPTGEIASLMPEVRDHDPHLALDGHADGLYFYRRLARECPEHLTENGRIFWEIGWDQGEAVRNLLEEAGWRDIRILPDDAGRDRVAEARRPAEKGE